MNSALAILQVSLLLIAAVTDLMTRRIPNTICLLLALLALTRLPFSDPAQLPVLIGTPVLLFAILLILFGRGYLGGGDVKLLTAFAIGLPFMQLLQLLTLITLTGGVLALLHLVLRRLPNPSLAPVGSSLLRRIYAIERWRHIRHAPLPYGIAIACGGIWMLLDRVYGVYHVF